MKSAGAVIVDPADVPDAGTLDDCELEVLLYEFKAGLNTYLAGLGPTAEGSVARGCHRVQRRASAPARCHTSARRSW